MDNTPIYIKLLVELRDYLTTITQIGNVEYAKILDMLPGDLGCRLRLVPDDRLSPRLNHLFEAVNIVSSENTIDGCSDYSLISIEGSNRNYPFDMDLILHDNTNGELILVDLTSSRDESIVNRKLSIIRGIITQQGLEKARAAVHLIPRRSISVDIKTTFKSSEPGTIALKLIDIVCTWPANLRDKFNKKCVLVHNRIKDKLLEVDADPGIGLYDKIELPIDKVNRVKEVLQSQNDTENLAFLKDMSNAGFPEYLTSLTKLCYRTKSLKPTPKYDSASYFPSRDLKECLKSLDHDPLIKVLHDALKTDKISCLTNKGDMVIMDSFPETTKNYVIPNDSNISIAAKHIKGHVFDIRFNAEVLMGNMERVLIKNSLKVKKVRKELKDISEPDYFLCNSTLNKALSSLHLQHDTLMTPSANDVKDSVWNKILSISALSSNDLNNIGRSSSSMLDSTIQFLKMTYLGSSMSHEYEVTKSIAASLKTSPSSNSYYVGINGSYDSVTVVKMSSTLDSFEKCNYTVVYRPERGKNSPRLRFKYKKFKEVCRTDFYTMDSNQLAYNLRLPYVVVSLATWEIENNLEHGRLSNSKLPSILFNSYLHSSVNRDPFAQVTEQVRYFYMSSLGYGGVPSGILDKTDFLIIKNPWELLYCLRMYKLGLGLRLLNTSDNLPSVVERSNRSNDLAVCFPHSNYKVTSFSQTISSMYLCNVYNKFRAYHEVSEAICYNELIEELRIYESRKEESFESVAGLSRGLITAVEGGSISAAAYLDSGAFESNEVEFIGTLLERGPTRYSGSVICIIGATLLYSNVSSKYLDEVYNNLNKSPIEACTMRGAMDRGKSSRDKQGIRAVSGILEELMTDMGMSIKEVNKSVLGSLFLFDRITEKYYPFTLFSKVSLQYIIGSDPYRYRIVQKDQKGHREISVLNAAFRLGALFVETIADVMSTAVGDVDIVNNPEKDMIIEREVKDSFDPKANKKSTHCYDNSDQKRWGPNHNMNFFAGTLYGFLLEDPGLMRLVLGVFDKVFDKRAKFPEGLIDLIMEKGATESNSQPIQAFIDFAKTTMEDGIFEARLPFSMCQGIFHAVSSVHHANFCKFLSPIVESRFEGVRIKSFTTSDDALRIIHIPNNHNKLLVVKYIHTLINLSGNIFNIMRNNTKSVFNFHIAELNSIFFKNGSLATPSLKQRIAKIDVGSGTNHVEDYMDCLSSSANYLSSGGSYMGAYIVSILNVTLHTEQWLRWRMVSSEQFYKPVELGGFPVIEPVTTILCGAIANCYMRVCDITKSDEYAQLYTETVISPPEKVDLSEFVRTGKVSAKISAQVDNLTIYKNSGPLGLFQLVRTDRKLSQFERRHGMSQWKIPDTFITTNRKSSYAGNLVFSIYRNAGVSLNETNLGVNSFYVRFVEPWVSYERQCYRISENSPFAGIFGAKGEKISHKSLLATMENQSVVDSRMIFKRLASEAPERPENAIMNAQLAIRLSDSSNVLHFLRSQEAESFTHPKSDPSIRKVILKGHTVTNTDTYFYRIIKTLSGEKSRHLINRERGDLTAYDKIPAIPMGHPLDLKESIIQADNTTSLFEKFIRRSTKIILPKNVATLSEAVKSILKYKFTETMGIILQGSLRIEGDRQAEFSHNHWIQDLLTASRKFQDNVSRRVLANKIPITSKLNIVSSGPRILDNESFDITGDTVTNKHRVIKSTHKDAFVGDIKCWLPANVRVMFSIKTLDAFFAGKLTYGHDYYIGDNRFFRYAKDKYFDIYAGGMKGTHFISVKKREVQSGIRSRTLLSYRHHFVFPNQLYGEKVIITAKQKYESEEWIQNIIRDFTLRPTREENKWCELPSYQSNRRLVKGRAKSDEVKDYVYLTSINQSTEFDITTGSDTLCIFLKSKHLSLPIGYVSQGDIDTVNIGYTLTHDDIKIAARDYFKLKTRSNSFNLTTIRANKELRDCLDFILVKSSSSTPAYIVHNASKRYDLTIQTGVQLDVLKTCIMSDSEIGLQITPVRFNQFLLNLAKRRVHSFNYFSRSITGDRIDSMTDSEGDDDDLDNMILLGESGSTFVTREQLSSARLNIGDLANIPEEDEGMDWYEEVVTEELANVPSASTAYDKAELFTKAEELEAAGNLMDQFEAQEALFDSDSDSSTKSDAANYAEESLGLKTLSTTNAISNVFDSLIGDKSIHMLEDNDSDDDSDEFDEEALIIEPDNPNFASMLEDMDIQFNSKTERDYGNIEEIKEQSVASVASSFTINPVIESAKSIVNYLKDWLSTAGGVGGQYTRHARIENLSQITDIYIMIISLTGDVHQDILEQLTGSSEIELPVELSALSVINEVY